MLSKDGKCNFNEKDGRLFVKAMLKGGNWKLRGKNDKMNLPVGNNTPALPIRYEYKLTPKPNNPKDDGIYFHYDDELYYMIGDDKAREHNTFDRKVYEKYGVQKDKVLNVFIMGQHRDSINSKTYAVKLRGVGFGPWVKLEGLHYVSTKPGYVADGRFKNQGRYSSTLLLHHEIGHCLGLRHSWNANDGCDDTPRHTGCWSENSPPPCDVSWSNNVMDYNSRQSAWTPCQLGTTHHKMSKRKRGARQYLEPVWCTFKKDRTIIIEDNIVWNGAKDIEGHLVIKDNASLTIRCAVSLPKKAKIIVYPKGKLILDGATLENDCGEKWLGIETWTFGTNTGVVEFDNAPVIKDLVNEVFLPGGVN